MQKLKLNDEVVILTGKDNGKKGKVTQLMSDSVVVSGVNVYKKTVKPSQQNPAGGIMDIEKPVHRSNVALVSPKTGKATRVRIEEKDGKKVRVAVSCGTVLDK